MEKVCEISVSKKIHTYFKTVKIQKKHGQIRTKTRACLNQNVGKFYFKFQNKKKKQKNLQCQLKSLPLHRFRAIAVMKCYLICCVVTINNLIYKKQWI